MRDIPIERMIETDSPYCGIKSTSAGIKFVKSIWPSKKKEKYDQECIVKDRNEPCLVRYVEIFFLPPYHELLYFFYLFLCRQKE